MKKLLFISILFLSFAGFGQNTHINANTKGSIFYAAQFMITSDSSTDQVVQMRAAVAAMPDGATFYMPYGGGVYLSDSILITKNLHIIGWNVDPYQMYTINNNPANGNSNFIFTSSTKNGFCVHNSGSNKNPVLTMEHLSIICNASSPTAGAGIKIDDNVGYGYFNDVAIQGFFNDVYIRSGHSYKFLNCRFLDAIGDAVVQGNNIQPDFGNSQYMFCDFLSGMSATTTSRGLYVRGGGGITISNCRFNSRNTLTQNTGYISDIYTDFADGPTSEIHINDCHFDNYQTNGIVAHSYTTNPAYELLIGNCHFAPLYSNSTSQSAIVASHWVNINITNIVANYVSGTYAYPVIALDSVTTARIGPISNYGWNADYTATANCVNVSNVLVNPTNYNANSNQLLVLNNQNINASAAVGIDYAVTGTSLLHAYQYWTNNNYGFGLPSTFITQVPTGDIAFYGAAQGLTYKNNGHLLLGTTSDDGLHVLQINGGGSSLGGINLTGTNNPGITLQNSGTSKGYLFIPTSAGQVFTNSSSNDVVLNAVNNVLIGGGSAKSMILAGATSMKFNNIATGSGSPQVFVHMPDSSVAQLPYSTFGGGGGVSGSDTWVQYNNSGAMSSQAAFAYNYTTQNLKLDAGSNSTSGLAITGTAAPSLKMQVSGTTQGYLGVATGSGTFFTDASSGDLALNGTANVLIGVGSGKSSINLNATKMIFNGIQNLAGGTPTVLVHNTDSTVDQMTTATLATLLPVGGSNTNVLYNSASASAGSANFTWNNAGQTATINAGSNSTGGLIVAGTTNPAITFKNSATPEGYFAIATGSGSFFTDAAINDFVINTTNTLRLGPGAGKSPVAITSTGLILNGVPNSGGTPTILVHSADSVTRQITPSALATLIGASSATSSAFTPTLTNTTNITSATLNLASYTTVGNNIHVMIGGTFNVTAANTLSTLTFTLPVTATTTTQSGVGTAAIFLSTGPGSCSTVASVVSGTTGNITFYPGAAVSATFNIQMDYKTN